MTEERIYKCEWHEGEYDAGIEDEYHTLDWFTNDRGYDDDDRLFIDSLEIDKSVSLGMGGHVVTRMK